MIFRGIYIIDWIKFNGNKKLLVFFYNIWKIMLCKFYLCEIMWVSDFNG